MSARFNVKQMSVSDLVSHIGRYKQTGKRYPLSDIRCLSLKDIGQLPLIELWAFLLAQDPELYGAWGEALADRRRKLRH